MSKSKSKQPAAVQVCVYNPDIPAASYDFTLKHTLFDCVKTIGLPAKGGGSRVIQCPNHNLHKSKSSKTTVKLDSDGAFICECDDPSCENVDNTAYLDQVLGEHISAQNAAIERNAAAANVPKLKTVINGVVPDAVEGVDEMVERTIYLTTGNGEFFDTEKKIRRKGGAFRLLYHNHFPKVKGQPPRDAVTHYCGLDNKRIADGIAWSPEPGDIIRFDGQDMANSYQAPTMIPAEGDVSEWIALLQHIYGEHWELVLQHMAFTLQQPMKKIRWQILTHGDPRTGKSLSMEPLKKILGPSCRVIGTDLAKSGWGDSYQRRKVIIIEEVHEPGNRAFFNNMKTKFANDDIESLNIKGQGIEYQRNLFSMYMFSNYDDAVSMEENDDKLLIIAAPSKRWRKARYKALGQAIEHDRAYQAACFHHLLNVDLSDFNPDQLPVRTEALLEMVAESRPQYEQWMASEMQRPTPAAPLCDSVFSTLEIRKTLKTEDYTRVGNVGLVRALKRLGFVKCVGQKGTCTHRFWARPGLVEGMRSRELFDLYEPYAKQKLPENPASDGAVKKMHLKPVK